MSTKYTTVLVCDRCGNTESFDQDYDEDSVSDLEWYEARDHCGTFNLCKPCWDAFNQFMKGDKSEIQTA